MSVCRWSIWLIRDRDHTIARDSITRSDGRHVSVVDAPPARAPALRLGRSDTARRQFGVQYLARTFGACDRQFEIARKLRGHMPLNSATIVSCAADIEVICIVLPGWLCVSGVLPRHPERNDNV
jgi:hypothetical protein